MRYVALIKFLLPLVVCVLCANYALANIGDPYKILGIQQKATLPEIRKAYKQLAKEW